MSDSGSAGQDGAVTAERFNGLMSSYQKARAENASLKAQLAGQASPGQGDNSQAQDGEGRNSQPEFDEGDTFEVVNGQLVKVEPPTPRGQNAARQFRRRNEDVDFDFQGPDGYPT